MLGILILQTNIQKELEKLKKELVKHLTNPEEIKKEDKNSLVILIMMELSIPCKKKILTRLR